MNRKKIHMYILLKNKRLDSIHIISDSTNSCETRVRGKLCTGTEFLLRLSDSSAFI